MLSRTITDGSGRSWTCTQDDAGNEPAREGQDVIIVCTTPSVAAPVRLTVGWQWMKMSENGLGRLITDASPVPRKKQG